MGTTQKGIIMRTIGALFTAGTMARSGGHFIPSSSYGESNDVHKFRGSSRCNNKQPRKPQYSLVQTCGDGTAIFRNRSTGVEHRLACKIL